MSGRRLQNRLDTRARIMDAAKDLFAEHGVGATTASDLAQRARVSRATFFNYFGSKEELLVALWVDQVGNLETQIEGYLTRPLTTPQRLDELFGQLLTALEARPGYLDAVALELERSSSEESMAARTSLFHQLIQRLLEAGLAQGDVRTDYDLDLLTDMVTAVYLSVLRNVRLDPGYDRRARIPAAADFLADAICRPRGISSTPPTSTRKTTT